MYCIVKHILSYVLIITNLYEGRSYNVDPILPIYITEIQQIYMKKNL